MKRIISLFLIIALSLAVISLTACGKKAEQNDIVKQAQESVSSDLTPFSVNSDGSATSYYKNDTDAEGRVTRHYTYNALGELDGSTGYEYDKNGNVIKEIMYNDKGEAVGQVLYEKTEDDRVTKRTDINSKGETTAVTTTEYTDFDKEKAVYKYDGSDNLLRYTIYDYDGETLTKTTIYNGNGTIDYYTVYEKDDKGKMTAKRFDADDNPIA